MFSPFSFASLFFLLYFSLWFSFNSLRSTLLLRQFLPLIACFSPPRFLRIPPSLLFQLLFFECMPIPHSLETLYFRSAVFPTVFSRFHCRSRDFLYLGCFNVAFIWLSLAVTFLFSRFPTFRLFSSLLFIFRPFVYAYTLLFKSPR